MKTTVTFAAALVILAAPSFAAQKSTPNTPLLVANPHVTSVAKPKPKGTKAGRGQHQYLTIKLNEVFISQ